MEKDRDMMSEEELESVTGGSYCGPVMVRRVNKGDTLEGLASKYGTTVEDIMDANGISSPNEFLGLLSHDIYIPV